MITNSRALARTPRHEVACQALTDAVTASHPRTVIEERLTLTDGVLTIGEDAFQLGEYDEILVFGGGNGAGEVALALEDLLGESLDGGIVVTDDPAPTTRVETVEGTHPLPSEANVEGTGRLLNRAEEAGEETLVVFAVTGGGSALLCAPVSGVTLDDYRDLTTTLLESGASIDEINAVRKHLSALKGGRLAAALSPARTAALVFSDVVGNRLDVIASGPLSPDETTFEDALGVLDRYDITPPTAIERILEDGAAGNHEETPASGNPVFESVSTHILADNRTALAGARDALAVGGYTPVVLSAEIEGEASDIGGVHAAVARECLRAGEPFQPPVAILSGGEATVTVSGEGYGGPNQEFALAAALELLDSDVLVAAVDTDGIDGPTEAAGAIIDGTVIEDRATAETALDTNDVFPYLSERDALVRTGQTGTNVNDLRILLVGTPAEAE